MVSRDKKLSSQHVRLNRNAYLCTRSGEEQTTEQQFKFSKLLWLTLLATNALHVERASASARQNLSLKAKNIQSILTLALIAVLAQTLARRAQSLPANN